MRRQIPKLDVAGSTPVARSLDGSFFAALCIAISCPLCGLWLGAGSGAGWFAGETLDRLELVSRREVRVAQRHRDRLVAHELLHGAQIDAFHHEAAGERVSQIVPVEVLDPCFAERRHEDPAHEVLGVKWRLARLARKDPRALEAARQGAEDLPHCVVHGDAPGLA